MKYNLTYINIQMNYTYSRWMLYLLSSVVKFYPEKGGRYFQQNTVFIIYAMSSSILPVPSAKTSHQNARSW
jgi:hypothetical protein